MTDLRLDREDDCSFMGSPNRQGFLVLGAASLPPIPLPESYRDRPAEAEFGILTGRCLWARARLTTSKKLALRPHDLVREPLVLLCDF